MSINDWNPFNYSGKLEYNKTIKAYEKIFPSIKQINKVLASITNIKDKELPKITPKQRSEILQNMVGIKLIIDAKIKVASILEEPRYTKLVSKILPLAINFYESCNRIKTEMLN